MSADRGGPSAASARARRAASPRQVLAVIGAGASGTLASAHLLRASSGGWRVILIDRDSHGTGAAYSTRDPRHLLNVPAGGMSAFENDPGDFVRWCRLHGQECSETDYLPRRLYGAYLRDLLVRFASAGELELVREEAVAMTRGEGRRALTVTLGDGRRIEADAAIVATGNPHPAALPRSGSPSRVIDDPWRPGSLDPLRGARRVLIVGAGLTAVDIALTLTGAPSSTEVLAISSHGRLPEAQLPCTSFTPAAAPAFDVPSPVRLRSLVAAFNAAVRAQPAQWRTVVDSLRPQTAHLWQALTLEEQRAFLRELKWAWDIHRHRMAPQVAGEIESLRAAGRLEVRRARATSITGSPGAVTVAVTDGGTGGELTADWVVNATGPAGDIAAVDDPLIRRLFDHGLARPDELRIGFACDAEGALRDAGGSADGRLFTIGPPRRGELLESTAIPEIRAQAAAISRALLASRQAGAAERRALATG